MEESEETLAWRQELIDRSWETAGPVITRSFGSPGWRMSAAEFCDFWRDEPMTSVSTTSASGAVHVTPVQPKFEAGRIYVITAGESQRLKDHRANPRCAIASWDGPDIVVVVYGEVRILDEIDRFPETKWTEPGLVTVEVTPERIYAIRPPPTSTPL